MLFGALELCTQAQMKVVISDLAFDAGADFAIAWHRSAVVSARLVVATQIAIVVGAHVLMMAIEGAFVVVELRFILIAWILVTLRVGVVGMRTVQVTGLDASLLVVLRTLP